MKKIRWVVSGAAGLAGRKIVRDGLIPVPNCKLVGVHSRAEEHAQREGKRYRVPWFTSVEEMVKKTDCDAIYIATPQSAHLEEVRISVQYKKHILCEKPLATNVQEAEEILNICKRAKVRLGVNFNYRFHPLHQKMKELIQKGVIGKIVSGRCQFGQDYPPAKGAFRQITGLSGGGAFADTGNHAVDLLEYLMDRKTKAVFGIKKNTIYHYETEDTGAALLEFSEGGIGLVDAYFCCPLNTLRNDIEINGTRGTLYTRGTLQMETKGTLILKKQGETRTFACPKEDMYKIVFAKFAAAILTGKEFPIPGEDGLHSQKIISAVYRSSGTGRKIAID
ncbi:MAG: Gfo/Idh/MocA family oxidoreductase [Candidatus Omnitrophota bacterium]